MDTMRSGADTVRAAGKTCEDGRELFRYTWMDVPESDLAE
jgi:hypothetical protein